MDTQFEVGTVTPEPRQSAFTRWRARKARAAAADKRFWESLPLYEVDPEESACLRPLPIPDSAAVVKALSQVNLADLDAMLDQIVQTRVSFDPFVEPRSGGDDSEDQADMLERGGDREANAVQEFINQKPEILNVPPRSMVWDMAEAKMKEFATVPHRRVPLISIFIGFFLRLNGASDPTLRQTIADMVKTNVAARSASAMMGALNQGAEPLHRG